METFNLFSADSWDRENDRDGYRHKATAIGPRLGGSLLGEQELEPGDVAVFPEGPAGGHKVVNRTEEPVRVLILSSKSPLAVVHYPDSGKLGIWTQAGGYQAMLAAEPALDYWAGEA